MTPGGTLTTIDTEAEYQRHARETLKQSGHEPSRTRFIAGRALDVLPRMSDGAYDVVVVDADRGEYPAILNQAKRLLRIGGVVAFIGIGEDDMVADPSRRDAEAASVKELATSLRDDTDWSATPLVEGDGMLVACLLRRD
jgi:predicted O-methyltransferase YrrM